MKEYLQEFYDYQKKLFTITSLTELLAWDQEVNLPPKASASRGNQLAFVSSLYQEYVTHPAYVDLVTRLYEHSESLSANDRRCVELAKKDMDIFLRIPKRFVEEYERAKVASQHAWSTAKKDNDFAWFISFLEKTLVLTKEYGSYLTKTNNIYEWMLDLYEEGTTVAFYDTLFAELKKWLGPLIEKYTVSTKPSTLYHWVHLSECSIKDFLKKFIEQIGFDFERGNLAAISHPAFFSITSEDNRVTTRYDDLLETIYSTLHETGHALYEMSGNELYKESYLWWGVSTGVHESQSRFLENIIGRSRAGASFIFSWLHSVFWNETWQRNEEWFYKAVTYVHPSLIRVRADEITYNLHVILRYEIEKELFSWSLKVQDLPEARNGLMKEYLNVEPITDRDGCLQDIHRSIWYFGYFPTYALGNIYSGQFFQSFAKAVPERAKQIGSWDFSSYRDRFTTHVWQYARLMSPQQLIEQATGEKVSSKPYIDYLTHKYM